MLVGTPGRLMDLAEKGTLLLHKVQVDTLCSLDPLRGLLGPNASGSKVYELRGVIWMEG